MVELRLISKIRNVLPLRTASPQTSASSRLLSYNRWQNEGTSSIGEKFDDSKFHDAACKKFQKHFFRGQPAM